MRISEDAERVKLLQRGHGEWAEAMLPVSNLYHVTGGICHSHTCTIPVRNKPRVNNNIIMKTCNVVLTFEAVYKILWCDYSWFFY